MRSGRSASCHFGAHRQLSGADQADAQRIRSRVACSDQADDPSIHTSLIQSELDVARAAAAWFRAATPHRCRPLKTLYAALLADGRKKYVGGGLSPRSVQYVHAIIHRALRDAVKWGRLLRNPADVADPPKRQRIAFQSRPSGQQTSCANSSSEPVRVDLRPRTTSLRQRECGAAKRWACAGEILTSTTARHQIRQAVIAIKRTVMISTPKTKKGRRTVALDKGTVAELREHRKRRGC
jgi:hypothetical protein